MKSAFLPTQHAAVTSPEPTGRPHDSLDGAGGRRRTPWAIREIRRRKRILAQFDDLVSAGCSQAAAARQLGVKCSAVWRWKKRVEPNTNRCGAKSSFSQFAVSEAVINRVERLQLAGSSNADAWRAVAADKVCPAELAQFLRSTRNIPGSFLRVTKLVKEQATVIRGRNFITLQA